MRIKDCLKSAIINLSPYSDTPRLDSEVLLLFALNSGSPDENFSASFLRTWPEYSLKLAQQKLFLSSIKQRIKGKPVAYITGMKEFWSLRLQVNEHTLIPRPDTEILVEEALKLIPKQAKWHILDLGTGSGAIALAIASERKNCTIIASDNSFAALQVAKKNATNLAINNCHFICASWLQAIQKKTFHLIISNPPYIEKNDPHLKQAELQHEPISALHSDNNGLADIKKIIVQAKDKLINPALLLLEHGYNQGKDIKQIFIKHNYHSLSQTKDYSGIIRITVAVRTSDIHPSLT